MPVRDLTGNRNFHLSAAGEPAPEFQPSANSLGALAHAGKTPVSIATRAQHLRIDPAAVVANQDTQLVIRIF